MNKLIISCFLSFSLLPTIMEQSESSLRTDFNTFLQLVIKEKYEALMDYLHPDMFLIFPKAQYLETMQLSADNRHLKSEIIEATFLSSTEPKLLGHKHYCIVNYELISRSNQKMTGSKRQKKRMMKSMIDLMKNQMGAKEAYYDDENFLVTIRDSQLIAISNDGLTDWKFIPSGKLEKPTIKKILPEEIYDQLN